MSTERIEQSLEEWEKAGENYYENGGGQYPTRDLYSESEEAAFSRGYHRRLKMKAAGLIYHEEYEE